MRAFKESYQTSKGIEAGSTVEQMKRVYPGIPLVEGSSSNHGAYELYDDTQYNGLRFEVKEGLVSEIEMYSLLP